jgi:hypothetical protein
MRATLTGGIMRVRTALLAAIASLLTTSAGLAASPTYIGAEKCGKLCHKIEYTSWLETKHAKAPGQKTGEFPGVQCEACHGPGSEYKALTVMKSREKAVAAGLVIPTEKVCVGCHNAAKMPNFKGFNFAEMSKKAHERKPKS